MRGVVGRNGYGLWIAEDEKELCVFVIDRVPF